MQEILICPMRWIIGSGKVQGTGYEVRRYGSCLISHVMKTEEAHRKTAVFEICRKRRYWGEVGNYNEYTDWNHIDYGGRKGHL